MEKVSLSGLYIYNMSANIGIIRNDQGVILGVYNYDNLHLEITGVSGFYFVNNDGDVFELIKNKLAS